MKVPVRVARVEELPPGRGRVVTIGGRDVAVYNVEGRLHAAASRRLRAELGECSEVCRPGGRWFDAFAEDSPARLREPEQNYRVVIEGEYVVILEEGG